MIWRVLTIGILWGFVTLWGVTESTGLFDTFDGCPEMKTTATRQELLLLEELAREEVEFWESYIVRCLENEDIPLPPRAIQALAMAEEKLNWCVRALGDENWESRIH